LLNTFIFGGHITDLVGKTHTSDWGQNTYDLHWNPKCFKLNCE